MKTILTLSLLILSQPLFSQSAEQKLKELGIILPVPTKPVANYVKYVRTGNLIYLSGHGPQKQDGSYIVGKLGAGLTIEEGYAAARQTGLNLLASLKDAIGDLSKVKRIVKVLGMVNSAENFTDQPKVINGFSDLMVAIFGEKGKHARSAVGTNSLPLGMCVEIEIIVEVE
jgi:enamine deaminase RidA (YjgF/YER057c/UK114 family)